MLDNIGERPVNTLDETQRLDVVRAVAALDELNKQVQTRGWWFNTEEDISLGVNGDGSYIIPGEVLRVDLNDRVSAKKYVYRAGKLYDKTTRTNTGFTDTIKVDYIVVVPFEELPEAARRYVMCRAGITFAARRVGAPSILKFTERDASEAWKDLMREDLEWLDANCSEAPEVQRVMRR
jgi:hypothetical protein